MTPQQRVTIFMGASGSGKSTAAQGIRDALVCSADSHFCAGGEYLFDPARLGEAHAACLRRYVYAVAGIRAPAALGGRPRRRTAADADGVRQHPHPHIVCDNTNTTIAELAPYVALAIAYRCDVRIVYVRADVADCIARTVHRVPSAVIRDQAARCEQAIRQWPAHWPPPVAL